MEWRLVTELSALVSNQENKVWLYMDGKKVYKSNVRKQVNSDYRASNLVLDEVPLDNNEFQVKLDRDFKVFVKSKELPKKDEWYELCNFAKDKRYLGNILEGCSIDKGIVNDGSVFEAAFSEDYPGEVVLACRTMKEYDEYFDEMTRVINCSIFKKTGCAKWKPGYRYDTETQTYYYLGEVLVRRRDNLDSELLVDPQDYVKGYLVVGKINKNTEKSVEDVLKNHVLGQGTDGDNNKLQVLFSPKPMVESGKALEPIEDFDITNYWGLIIDNAVSKCTVPYGGDRWKDYTDLFSIFEPLSLMSDKVKDYSNLDAPVKEQLEVVLSTTILNTIITTNSIQKGVTMFSITKNSTSQDTRLINDVVESYFINTMNDSNISRVSYYKNLFKDLGISVNDIAAGIVDSYSDEGTIFKDLNSMYSFIELYRKNHWAYESEVFDQLDKSIKFGTPSPTPLTSKLSGVVADVIVELVDKARESYGTCICEYKVENNGTTRTPLEYEYFKITLTDIVNYYNGVLNVPQSLSNELVACRFREVILRTDRNSKVII